MNELEMLLNDALFFAETQKAMNAVTLEQHNVMIKGLSGSGKTAITWQWAEDNGVLLAPYDLSQDVTTVYEEDRGGILRRKAAENPVHVAYQLIFSTLIKYKDGKNFVLLLDDYQNATKENLEAINYTIDNHAIFNPATGEKVELDNMLFTVAIETTW